MFMERPVLQKQKEGSQEGAFLLGFAFHGLSG